MTIQRAQMAYYRQRIGRKGIKAIRACTKADPALDPNEPISIFEINRLVPRGADFERYLFANNVKKSDPTNCVYHDAIRAHKMYWI